MRGPALVLWVLPALLASAPAAAEVIVAACADVGAGVEVGANTAFPITLQRDPAQATAARLDFTAYDPDNLNGIVEVEIDINPAAYAVPELQSLLLGNDANPQAFDSRSVTYSVDIPTAALVAGANTVIFNDLDAVSAFAVERVCLTLIDAPPPAVPPASEIFCSNEVNSPDPTVVPAETFGNYPTISPGATVTFDVDVALTAAAKVGLDLAAFVNAADFGDHTAGFSDGVATVTTTFNADNSAKNDQYVIASAPVTSDLLLGSVDDVPVTNTLTAEGTFTGRFWNACLVVEDTFEAPEPDAGPIVDDAGPNDGGVVVEDAGPVVTPDAGPAADAGGTTPPADGGTDPVTPPADGGAPVPGTDGGLIDETPDDAGTGTGAEDPADTDPGNSARAELTDPDFGVSSSCSAAPQLPALASLLLVALVGARRRRRQSPRT